MTAVATIPAPPAHLSTRDRRPGVLQGSVDQLGGPASLLLRYQRDHLALDVLLRQASSSSDRDGRDALRLALRLALGHSHAEVATLCPLLRRDGTAGSALADSVEERGQRLNELAATLDRTPTEDPSWSVLADGVVAELRRRVRDNEEVLLPRVRRAVSDLQLARLGIWWDLAVHTAPTRAHPLLAPRMAGRVVRTLPLTAFDRARDRVDVLTRHAPAPVDAALTSAGHMARTAVGVTERRRGLRDTSPSKVVRLLC